VVSAEPGAPTEPGRAGFVISQLYYYVVAAIGVAFVLGGVIAGLFGLRTLVGTKSRLARWSRPRPPARAPATARLPALR
jgi:hypothetical protein